MKNIKFLIVLIGLIGWQSVMAQKIGVGVEEPQTTLQVKNKVLVRDITQFDGRKKLWGLYIASKDFTTTKGIPVKKGQIIKAKFEGARKIYTYELFLKCGGNDKEWLIDIDYYALGISPFEYVVFLTEYGLYSLEDSDKISSQEIIKENISASVAHTPPSQNGQTVGKNRINHINNVFLYKAYVSGRDPLKRNPQYLLHASFSKPEQRKAEFGVNVRNYEKKYNSKGFYWRFKFIVIDKSLATEITASEDANGNFYWQYTMDRNMKKTATSGVNDQLSQKNSAENFARRPPGSLAKLFKDYTPDNMNTIINNTAEQPTATLDVHGNLSISDIKNYRHSLHNLANLFVDEDGYLYSFVPTEVDQKEMSLIEGYINTRGQGYFNTNAYSQTKMAAPGWDNYALTIGNEANVGDFDLRIPYDQFVVVPISSNFGNYDQKRRWVQQLHDKYGEFDGTKQERDNNFKLDNWYSNYGLHGYVNNEPGTVDLNLTKEIVSDEKGNTYTTRWWSYVFGLGHHVDFDSNPYNSQKTQRVFSAPSFDHDVANGVFNRYGDSNTWHIRLNYPNAQPIYGLAGIKDGTAWFQPQTFLENRDYFYWQYSVLAFSRSIIQDLGRMYDSMDYYRDYYANYNGPNADAEGGVKQALGHRSVNPAVNQNTFLGRTIPFLAFMNGHFNDKSIQMPIEPANGYHSNGYITDFKINVPAADNLPADGQTQEARRFDNKSDLYIAE